LAEVGASVAALKSPSAKLRLSILSAVDSKCTTSGRIKVHHFGRSVFLTGIDGFLQGKSGPAAFV
jgi:hypothetical protein